MEQTSRKIIELLLLSGALVAVILLSARQGSGSSAPGPKSAGPSLTALPNSSPSGGSLPETGGEGNPDLSGHSSIPVLPGVYPAKRPAAGSGTFSPSSAGNGGEGAPAPAPAGSGAGNAGNAATTGAAALKNYGNALGAIIAAHLDDMQASGPMFSRLIGTTTATDLAAAKTLAQDYRDIAARINALPPPPAAAATGSALAENYAAVADAIDALASEEAGGKIPAAAWQAYGARVVSLARTFLSAMFFFKNGGAVFAPDEPGGIFSFGP